MIQQRQSAVPTALQALMVLKQQASPTAPGPGGQPIPTVAAQTAQQLMQPSPQENQGLGQLAEQLRNALPEMQQQAQGAQAAQMLKAAQQAQQAQQSPGIAGLDVQNLAHFAEGGVVGFARGGVPELSAEELAAAWERLAGGAAPEARVLGAPSNPGAFNPAAATSASAAEAYAQAEAEVLKQQAAQRAAEASKQAGAAYIEAEKEALAGQRTAGSTAQKIRAAIQPTRFNPTISGEGILNGLKNAGKKVGSLAAKGVLPVDLVQSLVTMSDLVNGPASDTRALRKYYGYGPEDEGIAGALGDAAIRARYAATKMIPYVGPFLGPSPEDLRTAKDEKPAAPPAPPAPAAPAAAATPPAPVAPAGYTSGNADLDNMVRTLQQTEDPKQRAAIVSDIQSLLGQGGGTPTVRAARAPSAGGAGTSQKTPASAATAQSPQFDTAQLASLVAPYMQKPDLTDINATSAAYKKLFESRPDYAAAQLKAVNEAYEKEKDSRAWNRFIGGLEAPYRKIGSFYTGFEAQSRAADLANALQQTDIPEKERAAMMQELVQLSNLQKVGPEIAAHYAAPNAQVVSHGIQGLTNLQHQALQNANNLELERMREANAIQLHNLGKQLDPLTKDLFETHLAIAKRENKDTNDPAVRLAAYTAALRDTGKVPIGKAPIGWVSTFVEKQMAPWIKANPLATPQEQEEARKQFMAQARAAAAASGYDIPEGELPSAGAGAPAAFKFDPATGKLVPNR